MTDLTNCKILQDHPFNPETWVDDMAELQYRFGSKFIPFDKCREDPDEMYWWVRDLCIDLQEEWSEVLRCMPWKHWKAYKDFTVNLEDTRYEAIDCLHFVLNLYCLLTQRGVKASYYLDFSAAVSENQISDLEDLTEETKAIRVREYQVADMMVSSSHDDFHIELILKCMSFDVARMCGILGMDPEMMYTYYCIKNQENYDRQERGY